MFQAQSWALLQYLIVGPKSQDFQPDMQRYMNMLAADKPPLDAFRKAFGLEIDLLGLRLRRYLEGDLHFWRFHLKQPLSEDQIEITSIATDVMAVRLGRLQELAGSFHNVGEKDASEKAKLYYESALKLNPDNADALAGLARLAGRAKDYAEAENLYVKAIKLAPLNALHELDYGEYLMSRGDDEEIAAKQRHWYEQARVHLKHAVELAPDNPETLAAYGRSFLLPGGNVDRGLDELLLAQNRLPGSPKIKLMLANAYVDAGMKVEGKKLALSLLDSENQEIANDAAQLVKKVNGMNTSSPQASGLN